MFLRLWCCRFIDVTSHHGQWSLVIGDGGVAYKNLFVKSDFFGHL